MRTGLSLVSALALVAAFVAGAQAYTYTDSDSVAEPWSGWWWPMYHDTAESCEYCPHMWQGPNTVTDSPGPIYDLDTRYFWRPESIRDSAQRWEDSVHHVTDESLNWFGHCNGVSCAQALEPDPPTDCGALSQDDLEGLLAEIYMDCDAQMLAPGPFATPGSIWYALRTCFQTEPRRALLVDFYADSTCLTVWYWPVYRYEVEYDIANDTVATGVMTLHYEDHFYDAEHVSGDATYGFWCLVDGIDRPRPRTGKWTDCHGPRGLITQPDMAGRPLGRRDSIHWRNPYLDYDTIKRVIDHKTIVLDDEYMDHAEPCEPPGASWEARPGYAGSCWAGPGGYEPDYGVWWCEDIVHSGLWDLYIYKTPPYGTDVLDTQTRVYAPEYHWYTYALVNQSSPPFDVWQFVKRVQLDSGWCSWSPFIGGWDAQPLPCKAYFDALKLEYVGQGKDGGVSSALVRLGDGSPPLQVWPNPARGKARISYALPEPGSVNIVVYDVTGRAVLRSAQGFKRAGVQTAAISVAGLATGTYMARVSVNGTNTTCRFVVCR